MFNVTAEPVGHKPPYPRISIGMDDPEPGDPGVRLLTTAEICENLMKQHEACRVWAITKQIAEGTNVLVSTSAKQEVSEDGWEVA